MIVPLHVKSHHSRCVGSASPEQLVARAAQSGCSALALTDVENMRGQPRFHALCRAAGIAPITGVELRAEAGLGRIVLLARDAVGYANLCRIISVRRGGADADPGHALGGETRGLFVLSDDAPTLERLLDLGAVDRAALGLLLVRPSSRDERPLHEAAARLRVPLVADTDIAMLDPEDRTFHTLLIAALSNRTIAELSDSELPDANRWFRPPQQQMALFADVPQAIDATVRIAEQCQFRFSRERPVGPGALALAARCERALTDARARGRCTGPIYDARLANELAVIDALGYGGYFLAAAEIADEAAACDIAIAVRGSAAGSLVVHLLGISAIDPVAHRLHFERFLHVQRERPPDIDLDVCSDRREQLIRWVFRRFGRQRVALVGTLPTFQFDSALRSGLQALGASASTIERFLAAVARSGAQADEDPKHVPEAALPLLSARLREALPSILRLIGKPRSLAMHPGGVVIAEHAITEHVPVEHGRGGLAIAQYDRRAIEQTGLTKLDLLGNRFLAQLQRTRALADTAPRLHECPLDDGPTLARLDRADTLGCFQVETPLLRTLLVQMPIRNLEDCVAALALVRPGAAAGAAKREYLRFIHGAARTRPPLYDEDLLDMLSERAGISLTEADRLRERIIASQDPRELAELERAYVQQAVDNRRDAALARASWQQALQFAAYSFCKAHAWSYALLAYQSVYYKTHHLVEFGCALLDNYGGAYPLRTIAADLQRSGVEIAAPSINRSALASTPDGRTIQLGLARIKHLRKRSAAAILEVREQRGDYTTLESLTRNVRLTRQELRALILSGACDQLAGLAADDYPFAHEAALGHARERPQPNADPQRLADYRALVRIRNELELLDMHVTQHPMRVLRPAAQRHGCVRAEDMQHVPAGTITRFAGLLAARRRHRTQRGGVIDYLTFEDESGLLDAIIPIYAHARLAPLITTPGPYLIEGRMQDDLGHRQLEIGSLRPFYAREDIQG